MQHKDPELMQRIQDFAESYIDKYHSSPSMVTIGNAIGVSNATVHRYLTYMDHEGMLSYDGKIISTKRTDAANDTISAPLYTSFIPCGSPNEVDDAVEDYVALPTCIFGDEDMYVLRTTGKSMINAGIAPGDYVVVKNTQFANDGDIVVALKDNANTLKRLLHDENGIPYLHPENEAMKDIKLKKGESFSIQGVVRFIIKAV